MATEILWVSLEERSRTNSTRQRFHSQLFCKIIRYFCRTLYIQQDATLHSLFISGNCSTCFGWYFHPSSGAHTTVSTATGICHTVTATCRYRGR
jgi:hypothetical protein